MLMNSNMITKDLAKVSPSTDKSKVPQTSLSLEELMMEDTEMERLFAAHAKATGQRPNPSVK